MNKLKDISSLMNQWPNGYIFLCAAGSLLLFTSVIAEEVSKPVCQSDACKNTAQRILEYMDGDVKPCQNFYKFACGKFLETATIKDDETQNDTFTQLDEVLEKQLIATVTDKIMPEEPQPYRNVKNLYSLCMDEDKINSRGAEPAVALLNEAGGWPILGNWDEKNFNTIETGIRLINLGIGDNNLLQIYVALDLNRNRKIIQVFRAAVGIYFEYLKKGEDDPKVQTYFKYMVDIAEMYGANKETATEQLKEVLLFEIEMAKIFFDKKDKDISTLKKVFTLKELKTEISGIDWTKLFNGILPDTIKITDDEPIAVWDEEFLKKLTTFLSKYPKKVIANYMMWHAAHEMVSELTTEMRNRYDKFITEITEADFPPSPRWKTCLYSTPSIALSSLYVKEFFNEASKKQALHITDLILQELTLDMMEVDWMDERTRDKALFKASKIFQNIGYPDQLADMNEIQRYYEGLKLDHVDYFEASFELTRWVEKKKFKQLMEPYNKRAWTLKNHAEGSTIYYSSYDNSLNFPAGALQQPIFNIDVPNYINFATAGFLKASEITHAFDKKGCNRNFEGKWEVWCEKETIDKFEERSKCMKDQYSKFKDETTQINVNGTKTIRENIADNGGLKLAYRAYRRLVDQLTEPEPVLPGLEKYNQDQLFLLSLANLWCVKYKNDRLTYLLSNGVQPPAEHSVNGIMMNMPQFNQIFGCDLNDPMHAEDKCSVW